MQLKSYYEHSGLHVAVSHATFLLLASSLISKQGHHYEFNGCVSLGRNLFTYQLDRINDDIDATVVYGFPGPDIIVASDLILDLDESIRSIRRRHDRDVHHVHKVTESLDLFRTLQHSDWIAMGLS